MFNEMIRQMMKNLSEISDDSKGEDEEEFGEPYNSVIEWISCIFFGIGSCTIFVFVSSLLSVRPFP